MPTPAHEPTDEIRLKVRHYARCGTPQVTIGRLVGLSDKTLRRYYRDELDLGMVEANVAMAKALYDKALAGDVACMIFWLKTRAGWRETSRHEVAGDDGKPLRGVIEIVAI